MSTNRPEHDEDLPVASKPKTPAQLQVERNFRPHTIDDAQREAMGKVSDAIRAAAETVANTVPPGREQSLALTHLEQAMMFANAGIARSKP
jgi:hypothetical protein